MESVTLLKRTQKIQKGIYALGAVKEKLFLPRNKMLSKSLSEALHFRLVLKVSTGSSLNHILFMDKTIPG